MDFSENDWRNHPIDCQKYADLAGAAFNAHDINGQTGPVFYCETHEAPNHFRTLRKKGPCVLVTGASDRCVEDIMAALLPGNVIRWFSNNVNTDDPRVEATPIGFIFSFDRNQAIIEQSKISEEKSGLLYLNFTRVNSPEREGLYEMFGGFPWATLRGGNSVNDVIPRSFYRQMAKHYYVLSPPGKGPDCHRHWEAMALGSIPVVKRSRATRILDDMPCLQVDNWGDVTQTLMGERLIELSNRFHSPAMAKLSMVYWQERIQQCLATS